MVLWNSKMVLWNSKTLRKMATLKKTENLFLRPIMKRLACLVRIHYCIFTFHSLQKRSDSVVECLTQDQGFAGSSLTGVTALCP